MSRFPFALRRLGIVVLAAAPILGFVAHLFTDRGAPEEPLEIEESLESDREAWMNQRLGIVDPTDHELARVAAWQGLRVDSDRLSSRPMGAVPTLRDSLHWTSASKRCSEVVMSVASPTIPSWNQIAEFLKTMQQLRDSTGFAA